MTTAPLAHVVPGRQTCSDRLRAQGAAGHDATIATHHLAASAHPEGETEGGGGGADAGPERAAEFRVLAFWLGSVTTEADGTASVDVKLPESLTHLPDHGGRADRSPVGSGDAEVRTNKPVTLKPTFPRFLAVGDRAGISARSSGAIDRRREATVTMTVAGSERVTLTGPSEQQ